jgi:phage tail-like protein
MPKARTDTTAGIAPTRFSLTIDGVEVAQFSELSSIKSEIAPDDLAGLLLKKLPGKRTPPTITLRRGMTADDQMWTWHESARQSHGDGRKSASLTMYNATGKPVVRFHLENAWPSKVEISALANKPGEVLYEVVTLTCEDMQRVAV